jgi:acyl-CoA thioesterase-1
MEHPLKIEPRSYGILATILNLCAMSLLLIAVPATAREQLILAYGDSLTAGYQLKPGDSFPAQLEAALRKEGRTVRVHNAGVSGDTTAQGKARLPWVLNSLKAKPDLAIVALGANDMLRGAPTATARTNLDAILAELRKRNIPVIVAGMLAAPNLGASYGREFNAIYPTLSKKHGAALYPFFTNGVTAQPKFLLADGLHPNPAGVGVMVRGILPLVRAKLPK